MCSLFVPVENPAALLDAQANRVRHAHGNRPPRRPRPDRRPGHRRASPSSSGGSAGRWPTPRRRSSRPSRPPPRNSPTSASSNWARGSRPWANCSPRRRRSCRARCTSGSTPSPSISAPRCRPRPSTPPRICRSCNERLAVIDNAQKDLTDLASQVTSLRDVLSNKQTRGAFGQGRMEAIIQDGLPKGAYEFQYTLKNGKRPDCVVLLPDQRPLVIDAKFPLEGGHRVPRRQDRGRAQVRRAARAAGRDEAHQRHRREISAAPARRRTPR